MTTVLDAPPMTLADAENAIRALELVAIHLYPGYPQPEIETKQQGRCGLPKNNRAILRLSKVAQ